MKALSGVLLLTILFTVCVPISAAGEFQTLQLRGDKNDDLSGVVFGPVNSDDTLWKIAKDYRNSSDFKGPKPVSLYPVMYGIYLVNTQAFKDNNVNHLLNDTMLEMPTAAFINRIDVREAEAKIEGDETLWAELQALKNFAPATPKPATEARADAVTPAVEAPSPEPQQPIQLTPNTPPAETTFTATETRELSAQELQILNELKSQYAISLETIQILLDENERLADQLNTVATRVEGLNNQINDDVQSQIDALAALQAEMFELQQQQLPDETISVDTLKAILAKPFVLIGLISVVVLLSLVGLGLWLFKRSKPVENEELDELGEIAEIDESNLDALFKDDTATETPDVVSTDELAQELSDDIIAPANQAPDQSVTDQVPDAVTDIDAPQNDVQLDSQSEASVSENPFGEDLMVSDLDGSLSDDAIFDDSDLDVAGVDEADDEHEKALRDAIAENEFEAGSDTLKQDDLDALFGDGLDETADSAVEDDLPNEAEQEGAHLDEAALNEAGLNEAELDEAVLDETTFESQLEQATDDADELLAEVADELVELPDDIVAELPDSLDIDESAPLKDDDLSKLTDELQTQADAIDLDMDTLLSELDQIDMMESMLGDMDDNGATLDEEAPLSDAVELFEETTEATAQDTTERTSEAEPANQPELVEGAPSKETPVAEKTPAKTPPAMDDFPDLPDLDGWLNGDSDADILSEIENTDFDEILDSLEADDDVSLAPEPKDEPSTADKSMLSDFDDLALNLDVLTGDSDASAAEKAQAKKIADEELPDFIDVDALLAETEAMTRTEEPELDVLQNIADQLPAQTDNVVAESEALGKLDLARAYIEIDELKDAQSLLKEVLSVGNDAEREEANTLLEQLKQLK